MGIKLLVAFNPHRDGQKGGHGHLIEVLFTVLLLTIVLGL